MHWVIFWIRGQFTGQIKTVMYIVQTVPFAAPTGAGGDSEALVLFRATVWTLRLRREITTLQSGTSLASRSTWRPIRSPARHQLNSRAPGREGTGTAPRW